MDCECEATDREGVLGCRRDADEEAEREGVEGSTWWRAGEGGGEEEEAEEAMWSASVLMCCCLRSQRVGMEDSNGAASRTSTSGSYDITAAVMAGEGLQKRAQHRGRSGGQRGAMGGAGRESVYGCRVREEGRGQQAMVKRAVGVREGRGDGVRWIGE